MAGGGELRGEKTELVLRWIGVEKIPCDDAEDGVASFCANENALGVGMGGGKPKVGTGVEVEVKCIEPNSLIGGKGE